MNRTNTKHPRGMTLVELLLALAVFGVIAGAVASMLFAVAHGTSSDNDVRGLVAKGKMIESRFTASLRSSRMALASGADYVILWTSDARRNDLPNLSEIRRVERDASGRLWSYKAVFPQGWTQAQIDAADTTYQLTDNWNAVTTALKGQAIFPGELWATGLPAWTVTPNRANPQQATLMSYRITMQSVGNAARRETIVGAAALRNNTTCAGGIGVMP